MLQKETVLAWCEIERDLYEENGHVFGAMFDLFNNHINFYHRQGNTYDELTNPGDDIYDAIDRFNAILDQDKE